MPPIKPFLSFVIHVSVPLMGIGLDFADGAIFMCMVEPIVIGSDEKNRIPVPPREKLITMHFFHIPLFPLME
jgi:hypothetical protein